MECQVFAIDSMHGMLSGPCAHSAKLLSRDRHSSTSRFNAATSIDSLGSCRCLSAFEAAVQEKPLEVRNYFCFNDCETARCSCHPSLEHDETFPKQYVAVKVVPAGRNYSTATSNAGDRPSGCFGFSQNYRFVFPNRTSR